MSVRDVNSRSGCLVPILNIAVLLSLRCTFLTLYAMNRNCLQPERRPFRTPPGELMTLRRPQCRLQRGIFISTWRRSATFSAPSATPTPLPLWVGNANVASVIVCSIPFRYVSCATMWADQVMFWDNLCVFVYACLLARLSGNNRLSLNISAVGGHSDPHMGPSTVWANLNREIRQAGQNEK